jgi:CRISPR type I-E-associated protein CasB/Cse2
MSEPTWDEDLVAQLTKLADHKDIRRDVLAHLRHGLDRAPDYALARAGWLFARVPHWALDSALLTAGLFAWVKGNCPQEKGVNFGTAFGANADAKEQRQKRFIDLLDTDAEELPYKLRQAITLIEGTPLDWVLLLKHLNHWDHADRWVQKDWARGFWSNPRAESEDAGEAVTAS